MENILRQGNDGHFAWDIKRKIDENTVVDYDLTGRDLRLFLVAPMEKIEMPFTIDGNTISWTFYGKDQKYTGVYNALLIENEGKENMVTVDVQYAVTIVDHSWKGPRRNRCSHINMDTILLESTLSMGRGPRGYSAYEIAVQNGFEGTEQEWLDSLALTFDELTPEQKAELKGEDGATVVFAVVGTDLSISGENIRVEGTNLILV